MRQHSQEKLDNLPRYVLNDCSWECQKTCLDTCLMAILWEVGKLTLVLVWSISLMWQHPQEKSNILPIYVLYAHSQEKSGSGYLPNGHSWGSSKTCLGTCLICLTHETPLSGEVRHLAQVCALWQLSGEVRHLSWVPAEWWLLGEVSQLCQVCSQ